jgi:hypothetical protein
VTGSVEEVRAGLLAVSERLFAAHQYARQAGTLLDDAIAELTRLSEQHSESLVPAELQRARDELDRGLEFVNAGTVAVGDVEARL